MNSKLREKTGAGIAILAILAVALFIFGDIIFSDRVLSCRDLSRYYYPTRHFVASEVARGNIPLWNPYIYCGTPILAGQQAVIFYPLSLLYHVLPFDRAFNLFIILHYIIAGISAYLLARRWRMSVWSAFFSGMAFLLSGYMFSIMNLITTLSSVVWLPAVLLFLDKALEEKNIKSTLILSVFLAMIFLGGEPSIFYTSLWVVFFYCVFFVLKKKDPESVKYSFVTCAISISLAVMLSAIQLLPFIELALSSSRTFTSPNLYDKVTVWSLHIRDTLSFVIPFLARTDFSPEGYWKEQSWAVLIYAGVFAFLLVALSFILRRKEWRVNFLIFTGLIFLFVAYGGNTPFYRVLFDFIPGFKMVRYPVRFLYVTAFSIAMLCGYGLETYIRGAASKDRGLERFFRVFIYVLLALSIALLALYLYSNKLILSAFEYFKANVDHKKGAPIFIAYAVGLMNIGRFLSFFVSGGIALFLGLKGKIGKYTAVFAIVALALVDFISVLPESNLTLSKKTLVSEGSNIKRLKEDKSYFRYFISPKTSSSSDILKNLGGRTYDDNIAIAKDRLFANFLMLDGLYDAGGYDSINLARYVKVTTLVVSAPGPAATRILDMLGVKYLIANNDIGNPVSYKLLSRDNANLYENTNALPRAFLVGSYRVIRKEYEIAGFLKSKEFDPRRIVVLEEEPRLSVQRTAYSVQRTEEVEIVKYRPNEVVIKAVVAEKPKFLVLSDAYYPGWKVFVDGRPDKIYAANYLIRAVYLNTGEHTVRFVFDPFSFRLGLAISAIGIIILIAGFVFL